METNVDDDGVGVPALLAGGFGLSIRGVRAASVEVYHGSAAASTRPLVRLSVAHSIDGGVSLQMDGAGCLTVSPWLQSADMMIDAPDAAPPATLPAGAIRRIVVYTSSSRVSLDSMGIEPAPGSEVALTVGHGVLTVRVTCPQSQPEVIDVIDSGAVEDEDHGSAGSSGSIVDGGDLGRQA